MGYFDVVLFASMLFGLGSAQPVRLYNPVVAGIGYIQVQGPDNRWGFICDDCWNQAAAISACTDMNYFQTTGLAEPGARAQFLPTPPTDPLISLDDLDCVGTEDNLTMCIHDFTNASWYVSNCNRNELAAVTCVNVPDPTPDGPAPTLRCNSDNMVVIYPSPWMILPANLQNLLVNNGFNYLTIPYDSADTELTQTMTYIIYTRNVVMTYPSYGSGVTRYRRYDAALTCRMKREATVNKTFEPYGNISLSNYTQFEIEMILYEERMFTTEILVYPYRLPMGDWLNMAVVLRTTDTRLKIVVSQCLAEPVITTGRGPNFIFYNNKCLVDDTTSAAYPLALNRFGFRLQSFVFDNYPVVRLECDAIVCIKTDKSASCDRSCNSAKPDTDRRRRRDVVGSTDGTDHTVYSVTSPLIYVLNLTNGLTPPRMAVTPANPIQATGKETPVNTREPQANVPPARAAEYQQDAQQALTFFLGSAASLPSVSVVYVVTPLVAALMSISLFSAE
ncbi:scavenger receptor cysteine-rich domain-containing protein DMBT1-like [Littorina saxatilis]|uniref:ZP domain-containing protein n=1 Tax=Littorina saxatilis TaxID=31220 RepID=A0AAN9BKJ5_9CAEN